MTEQMERIAVCLTSDKKVWYTLLLIAALAVLLAVLVIWSLLAASPEKTVEEDEEPEEEVRAWLVTARELEEMTYVDSQLGELRWELTEESLEELDRVLREYGITTPEAISQFLAQAAVETAAGRYLTELGDEAYFNKYGYTTGTRGAGYLHLTFEYGQMAFAVWMMKREVPKLADIKYVNPVRHDEETVAASYYAALRRAANLGLDISEYSRIVYEEGSPVTTGADYIAERFAWESAGYYWQTNGIGEALSNTPGTGNTDEVSRLVGGGNWESRREAYEAYYPVLADKQLT